MQIHLRNIRLYAYHGLQPGEETKGSEYEINLTVSYKSGKSIVCNIDETIDYTALYNLLKDKMAARKELLETLAMEIAGEIISKFSMADDVEISIFKLHPPVENFNGSVGVTYKLNR